MKAPLQPVKDISYAVLVQQLPRQLRIRLYPKPYPFHLALRGSSLLHSPSPPPSIPVPNPYPYELVSFRRSNIIIPRHNPPQPHLLHKRVVIPPYSRPHGIRLLFQAQLFLLRIEIVRLLIQQEDIAMRWTKRRWTCAAVVQQRWPCGRECASEGEDVKSGCSQWQMGLANGKLLCGASRSILTRRYLVVAERFKPVL